MASVGSAPSTLNIRAVAGEPVDILVPILDSTGAVVTSAGSPSWGSEAQIRATAESDTVLFTFSTSIEAGKARIQATSIQTADWQDNWVKFRNRWDLVVTDTDEQPHFICGGWVLLYPTVTR